MTAVEFISPSAAPEHDPSKVRRAKDGRPYVKFPCPVAVDAGTVERDGLVIVGGMKRCEGRVPGKREGTTKQCPTCKGKGYIEKLYTRCTSFVGVLDDRSNLEKWQKRVVLTGLVAEPWLVTTLNATSPDDRETLDYLAEKAFDAGDGYVKAQKGTDLHTLTEYVDKGWDLPASLTDFETGQERPVTLQDRADLAAWQRVKDEQEFEFDGVECFVVQDEYEIGGTYDRQVSAPWGSGIRWCNQCLNPLILDLKTGRIDYGAGKIAQQLAVYANSQDYDPATGQRSPQDVCTHYGIVVHLPQGTGQATVHVVDLEAGWAAVELSSRVREHRRMAKQMIWPLESHSEVAQ